MLSRPSRFRPGPLIALMLVALAGRLPAQATAYEQLQTFSSLLNQVRTSYVDSVSYGQLVHAAIDGMLAALDPHSRFVKRGDSERELAYESGRLAGTGIVFDQVDGTLTVLTVLPRSPGARAGVTAGDRLLMIDDSAAAGLSPYDVSWRLLGEKGTRVRLLFERGPRLEPDSLRVNLKYDFIEPRSVTIARMLDSATAYVRLSGFHFQAGEEVAKALKELRGQGMKRLILDLRGNPGGYMSEPVEIASLFLPKRTLVFRTQGRRVSTSSEVFTEKDGQFRELPLMLLLNEGSASASEALAGSLQDHDRALLLGRRSFGKALIQQPFPVPPQGDVVWLTIGRVVTPSGRIIQRSYRGLTTEQYLGLAGRTGTAEDTARIYLTDRRREVRGGGGITPDVLVPRVASLPGWWGTVADSGWLEAVADSVAALLPRDPAAAAQWAGATDRWQASLVGPLMDRVHRRLKVSAEPDTAVAGLVGRILAYRAAEVRWGDDAAESLILRHDPDVHAAMGYWDRLGALLAPH